MSDELAGLAEVADQTRGVLYAADEIDRLQEVSLSLENVARARNAQLDAQRDVVRALARQCDAQAAATQTAREGTNAGGSGTQAQLVALDSQKLSLGKTIANLEQSISALEGQVARAKEEARTAEQAEPFDDDDIDPTVCVRTLSGGLTRSDSIYSCSES